MLFDDTIAELELDNTLAMKLQQVVLCHSDVTVVKCFCCFTFVSHKVSFALGKTDGCTRVGTQGRSRWEILRHQTGSVNAKSSWNHSVEDSAVGWDGGSNKTRVVTTATSSNG